MFPRASRLTSGDYSGEFPSEQVALSRNSDIHSCSDPERIALRNLFQPTITANHAKNNLLSCRMLLIRFILKCSEIQRLLFFNAVIAHVVVDARSRVSRETLCSSPWKHPKHGISTLIF